jgi:uncharacterized protein involved in exopolysaccharide biosynthesis
MNEDPSTPMRVSQWARGSAPAPAPTPAPAPLAAEKSAQQPALQHATASESPFASLPVDPVRLLGGVWKRRRWVIGGLLAGAVLGLGTGALRAKSRWQVSVQLLKRDLPAAFRVGEGGEAFRPHQLSGGTLLGAAGSPQVLERVAAASSPKVSAGQLRLSIEVQDQRNTDFTYLTLSGFDSAQATVDLANLWAAEVVRFTRNLQAQESSEMRKFLKQQVDATDADLRKLNDEILAFSKRENLVDAEKQIDAYLHALGEIDLKFETARINLETIDFKIKGVGDELRRQSPLADKQRTAKAELDELRTRYTDQNPLVIEKMEAVQTLDEQMSKSAADTKADPSAYAGTFLGNTLYLNYIELENEKKALLREKDELEKLRTQARARLDAVPEKAAAFAQLNLRRQSLETARNLLFSRLREAELFEQNAPGYYSIFAPAALQGVTVRGRLTKTAAFTMAGGIGLAVMALLAALAAEILDPRLRTGLEASRALQAPLLCELAAGADIAAAGAEIWSHWIAANPSHGLPRIICSPSPGEKEHQFWDAMFAHAGRLLPTLRLVDCGGSQPAPAGLEKIIIEPVDTGAFSIADAKKLGARLGESCRRGEEVWVRITGPVHEPLTTLIRAGTAPLVLVRLNAEETTFWKRQGELLAKTVGKPLGVVAVGGAPWQQWK